MIKIFTLFYREIYLIQKLRITFISKLYINMYFYKY